jgi:hypothetical protein
MQPRKSTMKVSKMKMYIAVLDEVPDFMVPTLVAHSVLGAHLAMCKWSEYDEWLDTSFRKVVLRVNQKEFDKIAALEHTYLGHENTTLEGRKSCAIPIPCDNEDRPNVLRCAKMWAPGAPNVEQPLTEPLRGGKTNKGGQNTSPSQITTRPPPPTVYDPE